MTNQSNPMSSAIAEMSEIVRAAAEPWQPGDSVKAGINRASRRLGLSPRRAITFWYARPAAVLAEEADKLRAWHRQHIERESARLELRLAELRERQKALRDKQHDLALDRASAGTAIGQDAALVGEPYGLGGMVPRSGE